MSRSAAALTSDWRSWLLNNQDLRWRNGLINTSTTHIHILDQLFSTLVGLAGQSFTLLSPSFPDAFAPAMPHVFFPSQSKWKYIVDFQCTRLKGNERFHASRTRLKRSFPYAHRTTSRISKTDQLAEEFLAGLDGRVTFVILRRRGLSVGLFLEIGATFHPSSWGWLDLLPPDVCGPRPPTLSPVLPPASFLHWRCWEISICSFCSTNFASGLGIWSLVWEGWPSFCGSQLFWWSQTEDDYDVNYIILHE